MLLEPWLLLWVVCRPGLPLLKYGQLCRRHNSWALLCILCLLVNYGYNYTTTIYCRSFLSFIYLKAMILIPKFWCEHFNIQLHGTSLSPFYLIVTPSCSRASYVAIPRFL